MTDRSLPYYDLYLSLSLPENISPLPLPQGYSFRYYQQGDEQYWAQIEISAEELVNMEEALLKFKQYYDGKEKELEHSMIFVNYKDIPVATITAYYRIDPYEGIIAGDIHWLAVAKEHQGKGLSKPLISQALREFKKRGYRKAYLHTQTHTWLACKIYLDMGFKPIDLTNDPQSFKKGWEIVKEKIKKEDH